MSIAFFAAVYAGGVLTILSPCILPVLPFVFASTGRPFARWTGPMLTGLVLAFVAVAAAGAVGAAWAAEAADVGRWAALALLGVAGLMLLSTRVAIAVTRPLVRLGASLERRVAGLPGTARKSGPGSSSRLQAFTLGAATGLLWAPCAGPVLALIATLAASGTAPARATALFTVFGAGAATSLGALLATGGKALGVLRRVSGAERWVRRGVGALVVAATAMLALGLDAPLLSRAGFVQTASAEEVLLSHVAPAAAAAPRHDLPLPDLGPLPDLVGGAGWLNGDSLLESARGVAQSAGRLPAAALRGRVVVINVWTFECYNCLNALPHIKALDAKYRGQGVVVIGVHTPELARERVPGNVADAVRRLGVTYPVVLDPTYSIWGAFHNEYWPSVYIADQDGRIRFRHFGEGAYDEEDRVVAQLLAQGGAPATRPVAAPAKAAMPSR